MPAPKWPPIPRPHKPSGQDRVRWRNREYYLGASGSQEARQRYADLLVELAALEAGRGAPPVLATAPKAPTVAEVVAGWVIQEQPGLSAEIGERIARSLEYLTRRHADLPASEVDALVLRQVREDMIGRDLAASTVNVMVGHIRRVWRWAEEQRMLPRGSWANLGTLPPIRKNDRRVRHAPGRRATTWEEVQRVAACAVPPIAAAIQVQWYSGCRSGEIRRIRVGEVDTSGEVWEYTPARHKTSHLDHPHVVLLGPQAQEILRPWLENKGPEEWVFPCHSGRSRRSTRTDWYRGEHCYGRRTYGGSAARAAREAGLPGWQPYQCRHAAKKRVTRAYGLDAARSLLGQASLSSTDHYSHERDLEVARKVALELG